MKNWSYSRYGTWKKCPALLKYQSEGESGPQHPAAVRGQDLHKSVEEYLLGKTDAVPDLLAYYRPFFDTLREQSAQPELSLAVDEKWDLLSFNDPNRWWRGVLDCVVEADDETLILDWKTGQEYPDHRDQREIYAAAYHAVNPQVPIKVIHVYFDKKLNAVTNYAPADIAPIRKKWEKNIAEMFADDRMIPNPGYHCRFCHFRRDNGGPCSF